MKEATHLVAGMGEIGKPIFKILSEFYNVKSYDTLNEYEAPQEKFDILHIAFGHKDDEVDLFKGWVKDYQERFLKEGGLTIIHSTVAVGVCKDLDAVHSPVVGQHPKLYDYISKLPKIFAGRRGQEAAEYWRRMDKRVLVYDRAEESEAAKLFLTESYRVNIEFCQRVKRFCDKEGLSFHNTYTLPAMIYNEGYEFMGHREYMRPVLTPNLGEIKGHCVLPNEKLIKLKE